MPGDLLRVPDAAVRAGDPPSQAPYPGIVRDLRDLVGAGCRFSTIYADPPWAYENVASRAAAVNHYSTMTLDQICAEPIEQLVAENGRFSAS